MGPASPTTQYDADDPSGVNEFVSESEWHPGQAISSTAASSPLAPAGTPLTAPTLVLATSPKADKTPGNVESLNTTEPEEWASRFGAAQPDLTVTEIVELAAPLAWQEVVAVIREYLLSASERTLVDPTVMMLTAVGEMRPQIGVATSEHPARAASELLQKLLPSEAPPSLLALAAQEAGPVPRRRSTQDLAHALAFFERPNRRADLVGLWARADTALARKRSDRELARLRHRVESPPLAVPPDVTLPLPWWESPVSTWTSTWTSRVTTTLASMLAWSDQGAHNYALGAALCGILALTSSVWLLVSLSGDRERLEPLAGRALTRLVVAMPVAPIRAQVVTTTRRPTGDAPSAVAPAVRTVPVPVPEPSPTPVPTTGSVSEPDSSDAWVVTLRELVPESRPSAVRSQPRAAGRPAAPARIYSAADADVMPATLRWPLLTLEVVNAEEAGSMSVLRLVVDENGHVERVRLISPSNSYRDRMSLPAVKAWVFQPAVLDDRPVKYQLEVRVP